VTTMEMIDAVAKVIATGDVPLALREYGSIRAIRMALDAYESGDYDGLSESEIKQRLRGTTIKSFK
jgi:hypothetical protein